MYLWRGVGPAEPGKLRITRASHVEPDAAGCWSADMGPSGGPVLGPYSSRSEALQAERGWLLGQGRFTRRSPLPDQDCKIVYNRAVQLE